MAATVARREPRHHTQIRSAPPALQLRQTEDYLNSVTGLLARNLAAMLELDRRATEAALVARHMRRAQAVGEPENDQLLTDLLSAQRNYIAEKIEFANANAALCDHAKKTAIELVKLIEDADAAEVRHRRSRTSSGAA